MMIGSNSTINLTYNALNSTTKAMEKTARALSTGLKAAHAEDDASGFAIGLNLSANRAGVDRAMRNAQDGISMLQTAEGGLNQINSMLQRMRELTIQAANDTLTTQDRNYLQMEIDGIRDSIDNMAANTTFNNKRLLDGSSAALWSADKASTKLKVTGVLTMIDSYGQKKTADGNYRIEIRANPGQGQVQKSAPMIIARKDAATDVMIDSASGVSGLSIKELPEDSYKITSETSVGADAAITDFYGTDPEGKISASVSLSLDVNASIVFEVTGNRDGKITFTASSKVTTTDGSHPIYYESGITLGEGDSADLSGLVGSDEGIFALSMDSTEDFEIGHKFIYNLTAGSGDATISISREGSETAQRFTIDANNAVNKDVHFSSFYLDSQNGKVYDSCITLTVPESMKLSDDGRLFAEFSASDIGDIPPKNASLRDLKAFYDSEGVFILEEPQTIMLTQGDGKETSIKVYSTDTIEELRAKLNDAIADGLGQAAYTNNRENFVSFVQENNVAHSGSETVAGTLIIRSAAAGSAGRISLNSENNDLINALGLSTIQDAKENSFTASVYEAHSGRRLAENITASGNSLQGVISPNITIEFDNMANVKASWNDTMNCYDLYSEAGAYTTKVHISDRSTSFQVGARDGEDMFINIGDMRAEALGLNRVDISTRSRASESISVLDAAIRQVSIQRTKIGTYQNELEYNYNSLSQTSLHLQESESRLKDADMAKEAMQFMKLQILSNTGSSMMAQANQNAQAVMNILNL